MSKFVEGDRIAKNGCNKSYLVKKLLNIGSTSTYLLETGEGCFEISRSYINEFYSKVEDAKVERPKLKGKYLVMTDSGQVLGGNPESTFEYYEDAQEAARIAAEKCPTNRTYYVASLACRFTSRTEVRMEIV